MWVWVLIGLTSFFATIVLGLCIPVDASLNFDTSSDPRFSARLKWLFGLVGRDMAPGRSKPREERRAHKPSFRGAIWSIACTRGLFSKTKNLIKDMLARVKVKEISVMLKVGVPDPADAGMLFGILNAAAAVVRLPPKCKLDVTPAISDRFFCQGRVYCTVSVRPISLVLPISRFAFSRPGYRVMKLALLGH